MTEKDKKLCAKFVKNVSSQLDQNHVRKERAPTTTERHPTISSTPSELTQPTAKTRRKHPKGPKLNTLTHQKPLTPQHQAPIQIINPPHKPAHDDIRGAKYLQLQPGSPTRTRLRMQSTPHAHFAPTAPSSAKIYIPGENPLRSEWFYS